jgi:uncharacterized protein (DUF1501 family)
MRISRRDFLVKSGSLVTVSAMVPRWAVAGAKHFEETVGAAATQRTLVVLEMAGGNDGLNMVVPYTDSLYYGTYRKRIGIPAASVLPLDSRLGLNGVPLNGSPTLGGIKALWDANRVAVVENVGYPRSTLSHFTDRDVWHTADPTLAQRLGWLGRWADAFLPPSSGPLACTAVSSSLPRTLLAKNVQVPTFVNIATYSYQTDGAFPADKNNQVNGFTEQTQQNSFLSAFGNAIAGAQGLSTSMSVVGQTGTDAMTSSAILQNVGTGYVPAGIYPASGLGNALKLCAEIISANIGARILYVQTGGFDNHAAEDKDHNPLLKNVSDSVKAFFDDLDGHSVSHNVLLMTWSEFGRRVMDNASLGTDHGTAAPHFVVGDAVNPGIYGSPPNLAGLDNNGNLILQNDFRSYYGTLLSDWLQADATAILGAWPNLGFVNKAFV